MRSRQLLFWMRKATKYIIVLYSRETENKEVDQYSSAFIYMIGTARAAVGKETHGCSELSYRFVKVECIQDTSWDKSSLAQYRLCWLYHGEVPQDWTLTGENWQFQIWGIQSPQVEVSHLLRWYLHTHTHTQIKRKRKWKELKMRREWTMLIRNWDARRRTQKKTEGANTNTTHLAQSGQTLKGHGAKKNEGRQTRNKTRGGGGRKRVNQPTAAKFTPIWARTGPSLEKARKDPRGTSWPMRYPASSAFSC